jgi:hypothetical protein
MIAGGYYYFESGAADRYGQQVLENRAIDPNYLPMDPGKISSHSRAKILILPTHDKRKRSPGVMDPFDDPVRVQQL